MPDQQLCMRTAQIGGIHLRPHREVSGQGLVDGGNVRLNLDWWDEGQLEVINVEVLGATACLHVQECLPGIVGERHRVLGNGQLYPGAERYRRVVDYSVERRRSPERSL